MNNTLKIKWQRLLRENETCPRCESTGKEVEKAVSVLRESLAPVNIAVEFEKESLSDTQFKKDTLESNRIWINSIPLENYIDGKIGKSTCCDVCGPQECRTVNIGGQVHEIIPAEVIIKAGLIAASQMITHLKQPKP